ncbi:RTA1 like protein-domain-containing protein [Cadophora sp. MPI-SDFR-AT-0126]|nr:RTA1 like protein-domain-containing protein [Leotiomycetes sp. MPI-SDFR-AT-0126]
MADGTYEFKLYRYTPSRVAAVIFVILFVLTTAGHVFQLIKRKTWYFIPFVLGGCFQVIGYVARVLAHNNKESVPIYSLQTILILLAPALYAASIYMVLARLIVTLNAQHLSLVPVKWMTKIFIVGDVIGFVGQAAGGGIMASGSISSLKLGEHITVAGLCVQILFFSIFVAVATVFHRRQAQAEGSRGLVAVGSTILSHRTWETLLYALYATSILIWVRSLFRVIEFAMGNDGFLLRNEVFLYVFDATLMFLAMVCLNLVHPARFLELKSSLDRTGPVPLVDARRQRETKSGSTSASDMA